MKFISTRILETSLAHVWLYWIQSFTGTNCDELRDLVPFAQLKNLKNAFGGD